MSERPRKRTEAKSQATIELDERRGQTLQAPTETRTGSPGHLIGRLRLQGAKAASSRTVGESARMVPVSGPAL
jgi:hypothetical protein